MADSFVQLNTGTGGAKAQTFQNTVGANVVDANAVVNIDTLGNRLVSDAATTGTITATDAVVGAPAGAGAFVTGASTAGSLVAAQVRASDAVWNCQVTGLTTGTLWFEGSLDSTTGTDGNWIVLNALRDGVLASVVQQSATANGMYSGNAAGFNYVRIRSVGTLTGTPAIRWRLSSGASEVYLTSSIPPGTNAIGQVDTESRRATYSIGSISTAPAATPTDWLTLTGSATKTVKIRRIYLSGAATTAGSMPVQITKRSTANTAGTSATQTAISHDSTNAAATAVARIYTVNPTALGTLVGVVRAGRLFFNLTTAQPDKLEFLFGNAGEQPFVLRGTSEIMTIFLASSAVPAGGGFDYTIEWTEE